MVNLISRLNEETGNPEDSVLNAKILLRNLGRPCEVTCFHNNFLEYCVFVRWDEDRDDYEHTFFGFTWGAEKKGLKALCDFFHDVGIDLDEDDVIVDWTETTEKSFNLD